MSEAEARAFLAGMSLLSGVIVTHLGQRVAEDLVASARCLLIGEWPDMTMDEIGKVIGGFQKAGMLPAGGGPWGGVAS